MPIFTIEEKEELKQGVLELIDTCYDIVKQGNNDSAQCKSNRRTAYIMASNLMAAKFIADRTFSGGKPR